MYYTTVAAIIPTPFPGDAVIAGPAVAMSHRVQMDHALYGLKVYAYRADLVDGRRLYRFEDRFLWRLPKDEVGPYIEFLKTKYRWVTTDPMTSNDAFLNEWGPI